MTTKTNVNRVHKNIVSFPLNRERLKANLRGLAIDDYRMNSHSELEITNDSLINIGIHQGDTVIVNLFDSVGNGDLAVIETPHGIKVGLIHFEGGGKVRLEPANKDYGSLSYQLSKVRILGRVVLSQRSW